MCEQQDLTMRRIAQGVEERAAQDLFIAAVLVATAEEQGNARLAVGPVEADRTAGNGLAAFDQPPVGDEQHGGYSSDHNPRFINLYTLMSSSW